MPLKLLQTLTGHADRIWTLAWNPSGTILASSGADKSIRLWAKDATDKWNCVSILTESHSKSIRRLCWSPCGQYLASASFDATVCLWRRNCSDSSWATVVNLEGHESEVKSVAWSSDGRYLASCGRDRTVWIWERAENDDSGQPEDDDDNAENWDCSDVKNDHTKDVKHVVWHPLHNILVSCSYDDSIKFFHKEGDDWKCYQTLSSHTSTVWSAAFSASGEFLATCSDDKTVRIWKNHAHKELPSVVTDSWKLVSVVQGYHSRAIYDISWSNSSDVLVSASGDNALAFYAKSDDGSDQSDIFVCVDKSGQSHNCDINCVAWNQAQPGLLASGGDDCVIKLWTHSIEDKGMKPLLIIDELINQLAEFSSDDNFTTQLVEKTPSMKVLNVSDFPNLQSLIRLFQLLQNEIRQDKDRHLLEKLLDLKFTERNPQPIELTDLSLNELDGTVKDFTVSIVDNHGSICYEFKAIVDSSKFCLMLPRRSVKFLTIANEVFLLEKTGDLYRVMDSGKSQFLLGHLFMFSDIKFVTKNIDSDITYVISADRDEKIRISNYPNTFEIRRFCFGHRHFVRKILIIDDKSFVSIDNQNNAYLWNLDDLSLDSDLKPRRMVTLDGGSVKRVKGNIIHARTTPASESGEN